MKHKVPRAKAINRLKLQQMYNIKVKYISNQKAV